MSTQVIGKVTTYVGTEHRHLTGCTVRIVAVLKGAALAQPPDDGLHIGNDDDLVEAGGVTPDDRVEVQPWLEAEGRFSFVTSDPRATDLECFRHLTTGDGEADR